MKPPMPAPPIVRVNIFGSDYKIATQADPDQARTVARHVDQKMREVANSLSLRSVAKIAVMTAVNLADDLFKGRKREEQVEEMLRVNRSRLTDSMDQTQGRG